VAVRRWLYSSAHGSTPRRRHVLAFSRSMPQKSRKSRAFQGHS